jgi:hypothetical protein
LLNGKSKHHFYPKEHGQSHGQLKKDRMITQTDRYTSFVEYTSQICEAVFLKLNLVNKFWCLAFQPLKTMPNSLEHESLGIMGWITVRENSEDKEAPLEVFQCSSENATTLHGFVASQAGQVSPAII